MRECGVVSLVAPGPGVAQQERMPDGEKNEPHQLNEVQPPLAGLPAATLASVFGGQITWLANTLGYPLMRRYEEIAGRGFMSVISTPITLGWKR